MKQIGVLTSGGDAPGMNAAIRAVLRRGISLGLKVVGIRRGYDGLIDGDFLAMNVSSVGDIIHRGGTILLTARSQRFERPESQDLAAVRLDRAGIDGLVVIGGEGSLHGALELARRGVPVIGVPATIDNDIAFTGNCIGFDTAVNAGAEAVNRLRDTAAAYERVFIVETMGRHSGHLALAVGVASGAESILIPELPVDTKEVCCRIARRMERGKSHSIIVMAEGAGNGFELAKRIGSSLDVELRVTVLGHVQRGGTPTAFDRLLASQLGARAVDLLQDRRGGLMVGTEGSGINAWPIDEVLRAERKIDLGLFELANVLAY